MGVAVHGGGCCTEGAQWHGGAILGSRRLPSLLGAIAELQGWLTASRRCSATRLGWLLSSSPWDLPSHLTIVTMGCFLRLHRHEKVTEGLQTPSLRGVDVL